MLLCSGKLIKKSCFSAILISNQGIGKNNIVIKRFFILFGMIFAVLAKARMINVLLPVYTRMAAAPFCYRLNFYFFGLCKAECKFIAMNLIFQRITHWSGFYQCDFRTGNHAHIKKMLPKRPLTADFGYNGTFCDL